jgi:hypothetical protein
MEISIVTVNRIFKTYQGQARIAELNSKNPVKRVQGQRDRVSISNEARAALTAQADRGSSQSEARKVEAEKVAAENVEAQTVQTEEVETEKNEEAASAVLAG